VRLDDLTVPTVVVAAPAGHGKTHEAVAVAGRVAAILPAGREVLFLAHTNAAVDEAARRAREVSVPMRCRTFDAFTAELVRPYAAALGLPAPLRVGTGGVRFEEVANAAASLLMRSPAIAAATGGHFPLIIADEHQDTRAAHHDVLLGLQRHGGSALRLFGDGMQAIYRFDDAQLVDWDALAAQGESVSLDTPHRWEEVPELGLWLRDLREALRDGREVGWDAAPDCVKLVPVQGRAPHGNSLGMPTYTALRGALNSIPADHTVSLLAWRNKTISIVQRALRSQVVLNEGAAVDVAREALLGVLGVVGSAAAMARVAVDLLARLSVGCNANIRGMLDACLEDDGLNIGRRQSVAHLADVFRPLYERPDLSTWSECLGRLCDAVTAGGAITIHRVEPFHLLAALQVPPDQDPVDAYEAAARSRRRPPARHIASTIHSAKGLAFDHVIVTHAGTADFPDTIDGRRLLYTALTRARRSITILVPDVAPSPLLWRGAPRELARSRPEQMSLL